MNNPWSALPLAPPFVLPDDWEAIDKFNQTAASKYVFQHQLMPGPYVGNPITSRLVVLSNNPGYNPAIDDTRHRDRSFTDRIRRNLLHEELDWPMYYFRPNSSQLEYSDGRVDHKPTFWMARFEPIKEILVAQGITKVWQYLAQRVAIVQMCPYHSERYKASAPVSMAQTYSSWLVKRALTEPERVVLVHRSKANKYWRKKHGSLMDRSIVPSRSSWPVNWNFKPEFFSDEDFHHIISALLPN